MQGRLGLVRKPSCKLCRVCAKNKLRGGQNTDGLCHFSLCSTTRLNEVKNDRDRQKITIKGRICIFAPP